ncbi:MAG: hypothetical protein ACI4SH_03865 [Candidatus Scatosoma sp.]
MLEAFKKIYYSGKAGDLVRIPCKVRGEAPSSRNIALLKAFLGKGNTFGKDKNNMYKCDYFGLAPVKDDSKYSYTSSYSATSTGGGNYRVKANKTYHMDYFALRIDVGASEEVAKNKKSNINKYLHAVSWYPRGFWFWIMSIVLSFGIVGLPLLAGCIYRLVMSFVAKRCLSKAKKSYKKNGKVIVF